jgi:phosphoenolpyruvate carboxykinase (ATP)
LKVGHVHHNLPFDTIHEHEMKNKEVIETSLAGCVTVDTGKFTGRSPDDKFFVKQAPSEDYIWWGKVNRPMTPAAYKELYGNVLKHYEGKTCYVFDGYCGSVPNTQKRVRFVTESAWQHHFVTNMFIRPTKEQLETFEPDFTVINACNYTEKDWVRLGLKSENFVCFNIEESTCIIGGTSYAGEMKKGILSMMTYWLPQKDHLPMHCSANKDKASNDTAIFFGLSGK